MNMDSKEHIRIEQTPLGVNVIIDDYELFDYVDDIMTERGVEYASTSEQEHQGRRYYVMHFAKEVQTSCISEVLGKIPPDEIERIWALNNE